jgi:hypothetical protein
VNVGARTERDIMDMKNIGNLSSNISGVALFVRKQTVMVALNSPRNSRCIEAEYCIWYCNRKPDHYVVAELEVGKSYTTYVPATLVGCHTRSINYISFKTL